MNTATWTTYKGHGKPATFTYCGANPAGPTAATAATVATEFGRIIVSDAATGEELLRAGSATRFWGM